MTAWAPDRLVLDIFERAIQAIWRVHGDRMAQLSNLRAPVQRRCQNPSTSTTATRTRPSTPITETASVSLANMTTATFGRRRCIAKTAHVDPDDPRSRLRGRDRLHPLDLPRRRETSLPPQEHDRDRRNPTTSPSNFSDVSSVAAPFSYSQSLRCQFGR